MKSSSFSRFSVLLLLALVACAGKTHQTTIPTGLPPDPTPTPDAGIITPENVNRLVQIKQLGMGEALDSPLYSPDGKRLFQATTTGVFVFDTASYANGRLLTPYSTWPYDDQIMDLSPDGKTLAMGNDLVVVDSGQKVSSLDVEWPGTQVVKFSPDGLFLARGYSTDRTNLTYRIGIWRMSDEKLLQTYAVKSLLYSFEFSPDGHLISIRSDVEDTPTVDLYNFLGGQKLASWAGQRSFFAIPHNLL
jgi:WD40 repeat protein